MNNPIRLALRSLLCLATLTLSATAFAHGDVTPQAVDISSLPALGKEWKAGIDAISGGIAPDLRKLDKDCMTMSNEDACIKEIDEYYQTTVRKGRVRNGAVYMPPFEAILQQEAVWAIKAYLETRRTSE